MLFEETVMHRLGVEHIPTFDHPTGEALARAKEEVGHKCGGKKIESCRAWLEKRADVPVTNELLQLNLCRTCPGG